MNVTPNTTSTCPHCGKPLKRVNVELMGVMQDVACYGSCGCGRSAEKLASFLPSEPDPRPSSHRCPMCGGSMQLDGRTGYVSDCPWCGYSCVFRSDLDAEGVERRAERHAGDGGYLAGTGVPDLYWDVEPDDVRADEIEDTGRGYYIHGDSGTLKTLTAVAVAKALSMRGWSVKYASSAALLSGFRDSYGGGATEGELFAELSACDLLIIDDIGKESGTSWATSMLYQVIDTRYGTGKPVIVTSNYSRSALVQKLSDTFDDATARAIGSRLHEMTKRVEAEGPDRRLTA